VLVHQGQAVFKGHQARGGVRDAVGPPKLKHSLISNPPKGRLNLGDLFKFIVPPEVYYTRNRLQEISENKKSFHQPRRVSTAETLVGSFMTSKKVVNLVVLLAFQRDRSFDVS